MLQSFYFGNVRFGLMLNKTWGWPLTRSVLLPQLLKQLEKINNSTVSKTNQIPILNVCFFALITVTVHSNGYYQQTYHIMLINCNIKYWTSSTALLFTVKNLLSSIKVFVDCLLYLCTTLMYFFQKYHLMIVYIQVKLFQLYPQLCNCLILTPTDWLEIRKKTEMKSLLFFELVLAKLIGLTM